MTKNKNSNIFLWSIVILLGVIVLYNLNLFSLQAILKGEHQSGFSNYAGYNPHPQYDSWIDNYPSYAKPTAANTVKLGEYVINFDVEHDRHIGKDCEVYPTDSSVIQNTIEETYTDEFGCQHWEYDYNSIVQKRCYYGKDQVWIVENSCSGLNKCEINYDYNWNWNKCCSGCTSSIWQRRDELITEHKSDFGGPNKDVDYGRGCWYKIDILKNDKLIYQTWRTDKKLDRYIIGSEYIEVEDIIIEASTSSANHESFGGCTWIKNYISYVSEKTKVEFPTKLHFEENNLIYEITNPKKIKLDGLVNTGEYSNLVVLNPGLNILKIPINKISKDIKTKIYIQGVDVSGLNPAWDCNSDLGLSEIRWEACSDIEKERYQIGMFSDTIPEIPSSIKYFDYNTIEDILILKNESSNFSINLPLTDIVKDNNITISFSLLVGDEQGEEIKNQNIIFKKV